jgi:hypothetical protein
MCRASSRGWETRGRLLGGGKVVWTPPPRQPLRLARPPPPTALHALVCVCAWRSRCRAVSFPPSLPHCAPVHTRQTAQFVAMPAVTVAADGTITVTLPADGMTTVTTVSTGNKGTPATPIPAPGPFPLPYFDDFNSYSNDSMAKYLSDQVRVSFRCGSRARAAAE